MPPPPPFNAQGSDRNACPLSHQVPPNSTDRTKKIQKIRLPVIYIYPCTQVLQKKDCEFLCVVVFRRRYKTKTFCLGAIYIIVN
jgi:hypothetical protein